MNHPYTIPVGAWEGESVAIIGGGPSAGFLDEAPEAMARADRIIAINTAYQLAPVADIVFWADKGWYPEHAKEIEHGYVDGQLLTSAYVQPSMGGPRIDEVFRIKRTADILSNKDDRLAGFSSGAQAINLAFLLGARKIALFGFDMEPGSWYSRKPSLPEAPRDRYWMFRDETELMIGRIRIMADVEFAAIGKTRLQNIPVVPEKEAGRWIRSH